VGKCGPVDINPGAQRTAVDGSTHLLMITVYIAKTLEWQLQLAASPQI
jgi:hypothetical protein